ncbi:hypothetical protein ABPG77_000789 [Micractinium sp. CCAP 211/92]
MLEPSWQGGTSRDGKKNGQEVDVDCGGICPGCGPGKHCNSNGDCQSGLTCIGGTCTASNVDCTGQCPGACPAGQQCAARSGNFYTSSTQCACFCQTGYCYGNNACQQHSSSYCNFNGLVNSEPGASYQCGSLPGSGGSACQQGYSCVQTDPTTYQCLPTDNKCPPQGCPTGTYCYSGRCICNGVSNPGTVTSKTSSCPSGSSCVPIQSGSTTAGQPQYVYQCCADAIGGCSAGAACSTDAQCATSYACVGGKCTSRCTSNGSPGCPSGSTCKSVPTGGLDYSFVCSCTSSAQCGAGYTCSNNVCTSACPGGCPAGQNSVCEDRGNGRGYLCYCPIGADSCPTF